MKFALYSMPLALLLVSQAHAAPGTTLFTLERNKNANRVVYELTPDGKAIHPYWRMLAEDGHTEELTGLEASRAYGVVAKGAGANNTLQFALIALPSYTLTASTLPAVGHPYVTLKVMGQTRVLKRVFIRLTGMLGMTVSSAAIETQPVGGGPSKYFILTPQGASVKEESARCVPEWGC